MSAPATTPNLLSEAIAIASGLMDIPPTREHFSALLKAIPSDYALRYAKGEVRCNGCQEWFDRGIANECKSCPDYFCAECKADHEVYCK